MEPTEALDAGELYRRGLEAFRRGDQEESEGLNEEALALARRNRDRVNELRALIGLSRVAFRRADHDEVQRLAEEGLPIWESLEDKSHVTSPYHMLAESHRLHGRFDVARELYVRNIAEAKAAGDRELEELETTNLAFLEVMAGNYDDALRLTTEVAGTTAVLDDPYVALARGAARVGSGAVAEGMADLERSAALLRDAGQVLAPADQPIYDAAIEQARAAGYFEGRDRA